MDAKLSLEELLNNQMISWGIEIQVFYPAKNKVLLSNGVTKSVAKLAKQVSESSIKGITYPELFPIIMNKALLESTLETLCIKYKEKPSEVVTAMSDTIIGLSPNMDVTDPDNIFLTNANNEVSPISGKTYAIVHNMDPHSLSQVCRPVYPIYNPRSDLRLYRGKVAGYEDEFNILNTYIAPDWKKVAEEDCSEELPELFKKLIEHLVPDPQDRRFLLYWIRKSLVSRAMTYLILCGLPGVGKNVLKRVMKALHGYLNTVDGKKSTLTSQFNSQLATGTLIWFDELKYNEEEENVMKEIPNDTISIEAKNKNQTSGTKLHASLVISNNKPRDNFIAMDARKFCPVGLASHRLEYSMTNEEISELVNKVDSDHPEYDIKFVASIANWIINNCDSKEWPNDEYKSRQFYMLTQTSMYQWQKRAIKIISQMFPGGDRYRLRKVSKVEINTFEGQKMGSMDYESLFMLSESHNKLNGTRVVFPDYSTTYYFLQSYRDINGNKVCELSDLDEIHGTFIITRIGDEVIQTDDPTDSL